MEHRKWSVSDGLNVVAVGSLLTTGGVAAGAEATTSAVLNAASNLRTLTEEDADQLDWDDSEEQNYRLWIRQLQDQRSANDISWSEFESEEAYRDRLRRQTEENSSAPVSWEDQQERLLRQKYIELRKKQRREQVSWDEQKAEADHRERIRKADAARKKVPVVWDDADERKCQERYRKKYSTS